MRNYKIIFLLSIFSCFQLFAQGSGYSKFGIGELILPQTTLSSGRAAAGLSLTSQYYPNRLNPAGINLIKKTNFSADVLYHAFQMQDTRNNNFLSSLKIYGFDVSLPVFTPKGIVVNFGLIPYSRVDYTIRKNETIENYLHNLEYKGDGGLSNAFLGISYNLIEGLSAGVRMNYVFGNIEHVIAQSTGSLKNEIHRTSKFYGLNGTAGLIYTGFGKLVGLGSLHNLNFGVVFANNFSLNAEVSRYYNYYHNQKLITQDSLLIEKTNFNVPAYLGFGISYIYNNRYLITSDINIQDWSRTKLLSDMSGELRKNVRYSLGVELIPYTGRVTTLRKFGFRAGVFSNQSYIRVNSYEVDEYGFTVGTDFPIFGDTRLALGFEYGIRGEEKFQKDKIYKLTIGIIGTEQWFVRPEEE